MSLMSDSKLPAKTCAQSNQMILSTGKVAADRKIVAASLGAEVEVLRPGNYFGQEGLLQRDDVTSFSAIATEYTELLTIEGYLFEEVFLAFFESDLYNKALYFANLDLFSKWSPYLLRQLALSAKEVDFENGECLFRQGTKLSHVLVIKSGSVKLSAGSISKPPRELLEQNVPPKDYLSEILVEPSISTRKPFKSLRRSRTYSASRPGLLSASPSTTSNAFLSQSRILLRCTVSSPQKRKSRYLPKAPEFPNPKMGFRLQEPRPRSTYQLCCLHRGEMLNHIETICNVKHSLLNAVSLSDTVVYTIDIVTLMQLLEKKSIQSLHLLIKQSLKRVQAWNNRNPCILLFKPLTEVLQQSMKHLQTGLNSAHGRKLNMSVVHSPEKLAYVATKNLGKNLSSNFRVCTDTSQEKSTDVATSTSVRQQFFIRQLTSESLDTSYVHVSKKHTSFDAPLPRNHATTYCFPEVSEVSLSTNSSQTCLVTIEEHVIPTCESEIKMPLTNISLAPKTQLGSISNCSNTEYQPLHVADSHFKYCMVPKKKELAIDQRCDETSLLSARTRHHSGYGSLPKSKAPKSKDPCSSLLGINGRSSFRHVPSLLSTVNLYLMFYSNTFMRHVCIFLHHCRDVQ